MRCTYRFRPAGNAVGSLGGCRGDAPLGVRYPNGVWSDECGGTKAGHATSVSRCTRTTYRCSVVSADSLDGVALGIGGARRTHYGGGVCDAHKGARPGIPTPIQHTLWCLECVDTATAKGTTVHPIHTNASHSRRKKSQYVLQAETVVPSSIDEVAPWFETPANLTLMTPPFMAFEIQQEEPMGVDAEISYRIRLFGVPMRWTSRIPVFEPGVRFVDTQIKGPYRLWWHEHRFVAVDGGTRIIDIVHYRVPVPVLGRFANWLWVGPTLLRIFSFRYHTMTQRFGSRATQSLRNSA